MARHSCSSTTKRHYINSMDKCAASEIWLDDGEIKTWYGWPVKTDTLVHILQNQVLSWWVDLDLVTSIIQLLSFDFSLTFVLYWTSDTTSAAPNWAFAPDSGMTSGMTVSSGFPGRSAGGRRAPADCNWRLASGLVKQLLLFLLMLCLVVLLHLLGSLLSRFLQLPLVICLQSPLHFIHL